MPQAYLERWTRNGKLFRYIRPRGAEGPLECKPKTPKGVAYKRDLYSLPDIIDARDTQKLELEFFQRIDDRAAVAIQKIERGERGQSADRVALAQFMISLLHRTPSRLQDLRDELSSTTDGAPYQGLEGADFDAKVKATANRLLAILVESPEGARIVGKLDIHLLKLGEGKPCFLTSDRPITISSQLIAPGAFMILPISPKSLVMLCNDKEIVRSFATQGDKRLAEGINQAIVEQAKEVVIAANCDATRMIDRLFLRPRASCEFDSIGLIRRKAPLTDFRVKVRAFSRDRKRDMLYLGL